MATKIIGSQVKTGAELNVNAATATVASSCTGNAATATSLATARTIAISGGATGTATSFDGTSNITIPVTSLDASKLTGTASVDTTGGATKDGDGNTISSTYLKLSGGTLTGCAFKRSVTTDGLYLYGGQGYTTGSGLYLYGKDSSNHVGEFMLSAHNGTNNPILRGRPDGTLTWNGNSVLTTASGCTLSGGTINAATFILKGNSDACYIEIDSGTAYNKGSHLALWGGTDSINPGKFALVAASNGTTKYLAGTPDGTLLWVGSSVQVSSDANIKQDWGDVPDEVLDAWGDVNWVQFKYKAAVTSKGESARWHNGLIAQHVKAVFEARGLDACKYGILCYEDKGGEGDTPLWMVRYAEAEAMESAYLRRRIARLEEKLARIIKESD